MCGHDRQDEGPAFFPLATLDWAMLVDPLLGTRVGCFLGWKGVVGTILYGMVSSASE